MTKGMNFQDMMQVFSSVVFSAMAAGQAVSLAPDYTKVPFFTLLFGYSWLN